MKVSNKDIQQSIPRCQFCGKLITKSRRHNGQIATIMSFSPMTNSYTPPVFLCKQCYLNKKNENKIQRIIAVNDMMLDIMDNENYVGNQE